MTTSLFTIGYEGLSIPLFFEILGEDAVEVIVDVRQLPQSRKPGFSKKTLSSHAGERGIDYVHIAELGCPKEIRDDYKCNGDWDRYTDRYIAYLGTQTLALDRLLLIARTRPCVLLCFEADPRTCHRLYVAEGVADLALSSETHRVRVDVTHLRTRSRAGAAAAA